MTNIRKMEYIVMGEKTTICLITALNGYEAVGVSSCVNPAHFNKALGQRKAFHDAKMKLNQAAAYHMHFDDLPF